MGYTRISCRTATQPSWPAERLKTPPEEHRSVRDLGLSTAANIWQYILPPDSVVYVGAVGKDKYADTLREAAGKVGLRTEYHVDEEHPTGRCGVVITGHNRSMCTDLAAANCYRIDHLKSAPIWSLVEQAKVFFVGGYHLTVCPPAIMALAEEAAAKDKVGAWAVSMYLTG